MKYKKSFYDGQSSDSSAKEILPLLLERLAPLSVVDVGCGVGRWLSVWLHLGVDDILGMDRDVSVEQLVIPAECFHRQDLTLPFARERTFDLAMCLEVAEHLPEPAAANFIQNLAALSDVVLFSAAIPLQRGTHHVNCQWPSYWEKHFQNAGFLPLDVIRPRFWKNDRIWHGYSQNVILYVRKEKHAAVAARFDGLPVGAIMDIVHPQSYLYISPQNAFLRDILSGLHKALWRSLKFRFLRWWKK